MVKRSENADQQSNAVTKNLGGRPPHGTSAKRASISIKVAQDLRDFLDEGGHLLCGNCESRKLKPRLMKIDVLVDSWVITELRVKQDLALASAIVEFDLKMRRDEPRKELHPTLIRQTVVANAEVEPRVAVITGIKQP